jgi:hypothetical protein
MNGRTMRRTEERERKNGKNGVRETGSDSLKKAPSCSKVFKGVRSLEKRSEAVAFYAESDCRCMRLDRKRADPGPSGKIRLLLRAPRRSKSQREEPDSSKKASRP